MAKSNPNNGKKSFWPLKISVITLFIAILFSFLSEIASNNSNLIVAYMLLLLLIIVGVFFDGIGVAFTACDIAPFASMASKRIKGSRMAITLLSKASIVANICADVVGDICGILSGAFVVVIVTATSILYPEINLMFLTVFMSSIVAAVTVGGKSFMKHIAMNNSKDIVFKVSKFLALFVKEMK